jgi:phosphoglycerate kinase
MIDRSSLRTLDHVKTQGRKVFLRLDINLPLDPLSGRILDTSRIVKSLPTIGRLANSALVIASHQSRPLRADFVSMERHAEMIGTLTGRPVMFVPDVIGPAAIEAIKRLRPSEALLLDNLRLCSEENHNADPKTLRNTHFVRRLSPLFDIYVNDAFAASHRAQPSLAGLPLVIRPYAGKLMAEELGTLHNLMNKAGAPRVLCLGGAKLETKLRFLETMLGNGNVEKVLLSGQAGMVFLSVVGHDVGEANLGVVRSTESLLLASRIAAKYPDMIVPPVDVAVQENGSRVECGVDEIGNRPILDIGPNTTGVFADELANAKTIFANGPAGVFEIEEFREGTDSLLLGIAMSRARVKVLGGGHLGSLAAEMGMSDKVHVSTGGGVLLALLGGETLPAISALARRANSWNDKSTSRKKGEGGVAPPTHN